MILQKALSKTFGGEVWNTGEAIVFTSGANAPPVKQSEKCPASGHYEICKTVADRVAQHIATFQVTIIIIYYRLLYL